MTSSARPAGAEDGYRRHRPDPACDPGLLDDLKCRAKGIQAQADYNAAHAKALDQARTDFEKARAAYSAARSTAEPLVLDAWRQLDELIGRIVCQLDHADVARLDRAFDHVVDRLTTCGVTGGCCSDGDCDYDDEVRDCDPDDVPGHIADITRLTDEATACFTDLITEPDPGLPARVAAVRAEIDLLAKAAADGSWEPTRLYAAALVARRHLRAVWRGFAHVNDYIDCLCHALTCMIKGHAAIGELTRKAAVNECYRDSWKAACKRLADNTVAEVLAEFIRVCSEDGDEEDGDEDDDTPSHPPDRPGEGYGDPRPPDRPGDGYGDPRPPGRPGAGYGDPAPPDRPGDGYGDSPPPDRPGDGYGDSPPPDRPGDGYGEPAPPDRPDEGYGDPRPPDRPDDGYGDPRPPDQPGDGYGDRPGTRPGESGPTRGRRGAGPRRPYRDDRGRYRSP